MKTTGIGARIVLVLLMTLLALPLAQTASPVEAKKRPRTVTRTFSNNALITIPTSPPETVAYADPYPATIEVSGLKGTIRDVNLRLNDFTHSFPRDVEVLLVGPGGQTAIVMAAVGDDLDVSNVTLTLDDEAQAPLPAQTALQTGTFRPTNTNGVITFKAPAPVASANASLSVFDGRNPSGTWRLFVQDVVGLVDPGRFMEGWELEITTKAKKKKKR